jgi:hypothetical protein
MRGPILNHRLAKMRHLEYEAEASRSWHQDPGGEGEARLADRITLLLDRSTEAFDLKRGRCAPTWANLSRQRCRTVA